MPSCSTIHASGSSLKTGLYFKRLPDALYVAGAEVLFYLQMELDKLLVLAIGGAQLAGIYAIIMRLVDLTAIPIRAFTMMLVQKMMRAPEMLARLAVRAGIEGGDLRGIDAGAAQPGDHCCISSRVRSAATSPKPRRWSGWRSSCRDCAIWWSTRPSCCSARGQMLIRALNLALLAGVKAVLLTWVLGRGRRHARSGAVA